MYINFYVEAYIARKYYLRQNLHFLKPEIYKDGHWEGANELEVIGYINGATKPREFDGDEFYHSKYDLRFVGEVKPGFAANDTMMKISYALTQLETEHINCELQIETR